MLTQTIKKIETMSGYIGSAILNEEGEIVYLDEERLVDLAFSSSLFNDTFRTLSEASLDMGLSKLIRLETETEEGMVFLIYSNQKNTIFTIFDSKGNISLAKMILAQALKKV